MSTPPRWGDRRAASGPTIDMTPDGEFVDARQPGVPPASIRVMGFAIVATALAGACAIALLALWLALTLIPLLIGAAAIAYGVFRVQLWWGRRRSLGSHRDLFIP